MYAVDGYHAIPLDQESQWMPQGLKATENISTKWYDNIIKSVPSKKKVVNDTLLYTYNIEESFFATWDFLTLMANNDIAANANKVQFCQETVKFVGLTVASAGVAPSHKTLVTIQNFPTPTDITWFGLVNQVLWAYAISPIMQPFRDLIKPHIKFYWYQTLDAIVITLLDIE